MPGPGPGPHPGPGSGARLDPEPVPGLTEALIDQLPRYDSAALGGAGRGAYGRARLGPGAGGKRQADTQFYQRYSRCPTVSFHFLTHGHPY